MTVYGIITKSVGGLFSLRLDEEYNGVKTVNVRAKGALRHDGLTLLVGDRVSADIDGHGEFYIKKILDRKNALIRPPLANISYMFIVIPCVEPYPDFETTDKLISIAEFNSISPVIVITKADLDGDFAEKTASLYKNCGFDTIITSSKSKIGCKDLLDYIKHISKDKDMICAFSGASGAGKSSVINEIFPSLKLETGDLSKKISRGKNTTRKTELFPLCDLISDDVNGYLADTPGFSLLDFERFDFFDLNDLFSTFREFQSSFGKCRYTKCSHTKEDGCDILRRVDEGSIAKSRFDSYVSIYNILKTKPKWKK